MVFVPGTCDAMLWYYVSANVWTAIVLGKATECGVAASWDGSTELAGSGDVMFVGVTWYDSGGKIAPVGPTDVVVSAGALVVPRLVLLLIPGCLGVGGLLVLCVELFDV